MITKIAALALLLFVPGTSVMAGDDSVFDADRMTRETFSFSAFTDHMLKTKQFGNSEEENPALRTMKHTLLRLFPPGSDIEEFFVFFDNVTERELKNPDTIEDQSDYLKNGRKSVHAISVTGETAVADYRYKLKFRVILYDHRYWRLWLRETVYLIKIDLENGRISDLTVRVGVGA